MLQEREDYLSPVGFATEPAGERRKWVSRILLAVVVGLVGWLILTKVFTPPTDNRAPTEASPLPGPI